MTITVTSKTYLTQERKLTEATLAAFKITGTAHEIVFPYYRDGVLINLKYLSLERFNGKKKIRVETNCEPCLFGWQSLRTNTREVTICEGEIDAMSLYQYDIPALSMPFGGGTGAKQQWPEYEFERLAGFDKIYLCMDDDQEEQAATAELIERLGPHRCFVVKLPHKDANACLQIGISGEEIAKCFAKAHSLDPRELKSAQLFVRQVIEEFYPKDDIVPGIHPPWEKARGKILFRPDELSIWSGINGHGKSQLLGQIILETMRQEHKVCIASLELKPRRLLARLTRQAAGLHNPTVGYIEAIHQWYGEHLWLFDLVGSTKSQRLLEVFLYARQRYGITVFVIDSFMKLDIAEDDYKGQKAFLEKLCDFKNEFNCHIHLMVHPRKGVDEAKWRGKLDTKGTGAITDLADNCFVVWRNKAKEAAIHQAGSQHYPIPADIADKPDVLWICDKQRNGEEEGKFGLWFHQAPCNILATHIKNQWNMCRTLCFPIKLNIVKHTMSNRKTIKNKKLINPNSESSLNVLMMPLVNSVNSVLGVKKIPFANMPDILNKIRKTNKQIAAGDLRHLDDMLINQAHVLESIFYACTERMINGQYLNQMRLYSEIALKAQKQCRNTVMAIASLKNPKQTTFVKQQNNAINQQVNNSENTLNQSNEVLSLEAEYGKMDIRTPFTAGQTYSELEAMDKVDSS